MLISIDLGLYSLVCIALGLSLSINAIFIILRVGKKYPHFIYKED